MTSSPETKSGGLNYGLVAGVVLVLAVGVLAWMWQSERAARRAAVQSERAMMLRMVQMQATAAAQPLVPDQMENVVVDTHGPQPAMQLVPVVARQLLEYFPPAADARVLIVTGRDVSVEAIGGSKKAADEGTKYLSKPAGASIDTAPRATTN